MSQSKWNDKKQAEFIVDMLVEAKVSSSLKDKNQNITISNSKYKTKFNHYFDRCVDLLVENARFSSEVPYTLREGIVSESIFMAADKNFLQHSVISDFIKKKEKEYLEKPKIEYVLLTTCLVPDSSGVEYKALQEVDLWAIYTMLTPRQRFESEKKYKHLKRQSLS